MSQNDVETLRAARAVLDRHGFDVDDLQACIDAALQANEDERLDDGSETHDADNDGCAGGIAATH